PGLTLVRGANGAGKTTLLRALAGLVPLGRGTRSADGAPLYLGHRPMLLRGLSAHANLSFLAAFRGGPPADVRAALARWGLEGVSDRPVERLSAGQRKRTALARLDTEPAPTVLLDEPFAELDADGAALLRAAVRAATTAGRAVVLVTHQADELDMEAARRFVVRDGAVHGA
ncbi:MAG: ATP-binding cassette domain-containing protein, partial [Chloroflexota bacterium]|nr:ATP-binding cassette domain-containing protein [Chloroflexota bacterium]